MIAFAGVVAVVAVMVVEGLYWWRHVGVTDAWVDADFTELGSGVNGRIARIAVRKGDAVTKGDLLAEMDSELVALDVEAFAADLEKARAERAQVEAEMATFRQDLDDSIQSIKTILGVMARESAALDSRYVLADRTVSRNAQLLKRQAISKRAEDAARDKRLEIVSARRDLDSKMTQKQRRIAELEGSRIKEGVFLARIGVIEREIEALSVRLDQAKRRLRKMHIYAPISGVVNEVFVNPGAYVEDGDRVLLLHDPARLWIEAPVDDSVVRHVAVGQPVEIDVDAYPYDSFQGVVVAVGHVTAATISGAAADAQRTPRIPVIIDIDPTDKPLWPGIRATANIRIR